MARIAFAWEMGGEFGHAMACAMLARALHARGHSIAFVFRDLAPLAFLPETGAYDVFQAPRAEREGVAAQAPVSFADLMLGSGYGDPTDLTRLLTTWRSILAGWKADLVVADFAPTALLAARSLGIARVTYGNGFFQPPLTTPIPPFRYDEPVSRERVLDAEARTLAAVNAALGAVGSAPLARLAEQFEADEHFLCTFPEFDHYQERPVSGYWGPRLRFDSGLALDWPKGTGKRVFVYVKRSLPQLDALIDCLAASPHRVIAFIPNLDEERRARLASPRRIAASRPARVDMLMRGCDLLVCHGGEMGAGAVLLGVPVLLFPGHYEQYLSARRVEQLGCGAWFGRKATSADIAHGLDTVLSNPRFAAAARLYAQQHASFSPAEQRRRIVARIEDVLAARGVASPRADPAILTPSKNGPGTTR